MYRNDHGEPVKLSVFLGSPKKGLEHIREAILRAILESGHIPDGMELWAASAQPTLQAIAAKLEFCDVHVVVLGSRYGSLLKRQKISFTEWEFRQSEAAGRPVVSFLLDEESVKDAWSQDRPETLERRYYRRFREKLRSKSLCKFFSEKGTPRIDRDVVTALNEIMNGQLRPFAGWIRAESKAARITGALQGNPVLMRIMERVVGFQTTGSRIDKESDAKKAAAEMFWDSMMNLLARRGYMNIFLESGSSIAYVSEALERKEIRQQGWKIDTNNALALLQLLLFTDGEVQRNPPVSPDPHDPYGAIFTKKCLDAYEEPPLEPRQLYDKELEAIKEVIKLLTTNKAKQVILATASGWDTRHRIKDFQGPHVGSHANMLFKRAIFMAGQPVVLFLSRHKVDPRFPEADFKCREGKEDQRLMSAIRYCYPVFGSELPLSKALRDTP